MLTLFAEMTSEVALSGGLLMPGDSTPLVLIFVAGRLVATTRKGRTTGCNAAVHLGLVLKSNVVLTANFTCRKGDQPVVVVLGKEKQYVPLQSARCT
jgi:hypothetical protein